MPFVLWLALAAFSSSLKAQITFNPYAGRYEIAPRNAAPRLNPLTGEFEIASSGSVPKYTNNREHGRWRPRTLFHGSTHIVENGKWRLRMRGSSLTPIRTNGIIPGNANKPDWIL
jgi:hypothetical protein